MTELDEHEIAWLQTVIHLLPTALVQVGTTTATGLGCIHNADFVFIKHRICHGPPAPHAVLILIGILHGAVASDKHHGLAIRTIHLPGVQFHVLHHRLQRVQRRVAAGHQALGSRTGIHHRTKTTGVYLIQEEVVIGFPSTIAVQLSARYLVQVDKGHALFGSHLHQPLGVRFADNLAVLVVGITRGERHQDGIAALRTYIINILTHVAAIGIYGFVFARFLNHHVQRIIAHAGDTGTRAALVVGSVIVMADTDNHPVARTDSLLDGLPQLVVEGTTTHTAKCLILNGYLIGIKVFVCIVAPAPLTVVTITQGTRTHG